MDSTKNKLFCDVRRDVVAPNLDGAKTTLQKIQLDASGNKNVYVDYGHFFLCLW